jgi:hypothetical protein
LFWIGREGRKKKGILPIPPALFPLFQNRNPLYFLSLLLSIRPQLLNYSTKITLPLYNYTPRIFSKTPS